MKRRRHSTKADGISDMSSSIIILWISWLTNHLDKKNAIKALGIQWHTAKDIFTFKISLPETKTITKRTILSDLARLYDPMGWIAPCVIVGKIIMQDIWKQNQTWDSELPATLEVACGPLV